MNDYTSPAVNLCHICKTYKITFNPRLFYENALTGDCTCTFCMAELLSDLLAERDAALARKDAALRMAVEAMEWARQNLDHQYNRCFTYTHNSECACRIQDVEAALAACREAMDKESG